MGLEEKESLKTQVDALVNGKQNFYRQELHLAKENNSTAEKDWGKSADLNKIMEKHPNCLFIYDDF